MKKKVKFFRNKGIGEFIFTVFDAASDTFAIPTTGTGYNYNIRTSDGYTASGVTGNHTITFPSGFGGHTVYISGSFPRIYFNVSGDRFKIQEIQQWGIYGIGSTLQSDAFEGCLNLEITATDLPNVSSVTNMSSMFRNCNALTNIPVLDTSSVSVFGGSFRGMFQQCATLTTIPLLDVSSGTNFQDFCRSSPIANFPANFFDGCSATTFTNAFMTTNLTQTSIDNILVSIESNGTSGGTFLQSGGSAPSTTGESAIDALRSRSWTITVTGGY